MIVIFILPFQLFEPENTVCFVTWHASVMQMSSNGISKEGHDIHLMHKSLGFMCDVQQDKFSSDLNKGLYDDL